MTLRVVVFSLCLLFLSSCTASRVPDAQESAGTDGYGSSVTENDSGRDVISDPGIYTDAVNAWARSGEYTVKSVRRLKSITGTLSYVFCQLEPAGYVLLTEKGYFIREWFGVQSLSFVLDGKDCYGLPSGAIAERQGESYVYLTNGYPLTAQDLLTVQEQEAVIAAREAPEGLPDTVGSLTLAQATELVRSFEEDDRLIYRVTRLKCAVDPAEIPNSLYGGDWYLLELAPCGYVILTSDGKFVAGAYDAPSAPVAFEAEKEYYYKGMASFYEMQPDGTLLPVYTSMHRNDAG